MRIFISWSGNTSQSVASVIHRYLPLIFQNIRVFMSGHDLESGSRWSNELSHQLEKSSFGILCLTHDNLSNPWIIFEAGALTKHIDGRACGLLLGDLKAIDIVGPLSQFQNRKFQKKDIEGLIFDINKKLNIPLENEILKTTIKTWWPKIENEYSNILDNLELAKTYKPRNQADIVEETLTRVRNIEKEIPHFNNNIDTFPSSVLRELCDHDVVTLYKVILHYYSRNTPYTPKDQNENETIDELCELELLERNSHGDPIIHSLLIKKSPILNQIDHVRSWVLNK